MGGSDPGEWLLLILSCCYICWVICELLYIDELWDGMSSLARICLLCSLYFWVELQASVGLNCGLSMVRHQGAGCASTVPSK